MQLYMCRSDLVSIQRVYAGSCVLEPATLDQFMVYDYYTTMYIKLYSYMIFFVDNKHNLLYSYIDIFLHKIWENCHYDMQTDLYSLAICD